MPRLRARRLPWFVGGVVAATAVLLGSYAYAATLSGGTLTLNPGDKVTATCANRLSTSGRTAHQITVACAPNPTPPPPPPTSTCNLQATPTDTPGPLAFCDPLNTPFTTLPTNTREGQLNGAVWGTAENTGNDIADPIPTVPSACVPGGNVDYPNNNEVCDGHLHTTVADYGVTSLADYVRQPFDFAGRTGTIVFDLANNVDRLIDAWPEIWVADQPVPDPFSFLGATVTLPRNGFAIRLSGCTDSTGGQNNCPDGNNGTGVFQAAVVNNYHLLDSAVNGPLAYGTGQDILKSQPGQMNHYQIEVTPTALQVYGTNPFTGTWNPAVDPLIHLSTIKGFGTLNLTRGLVYLETVGYNSNQPPPNAPEPDHTFVWGNVGFDGPTLPRDLTYDVPNNHVADNTSGSINGGPGFDNAYQMNTDETVTLSTPAIPASSIANASGALLTFDFYSRQTIPIAVSVNGHDLSEPWPYPDSGGYTYRAVAISVPLTDLMPGANDITFSTGDYVESVSNIDIIAQAAGGVVPPS